MRTFSFNQGTRPLSLEQIAQVAPSVFADRPYHAVSERYKFIPTSNILSGLQSEGWQVMRATEQRVRLADKKGFTKHCLIFQHVDAQPLAKVGDTMPRIVLTNSHDRASGYVVEAGLFRLACLNGLMVSDANIGKVSVRHSGTDIIERVIEGTYSVMSDMAEISSHAADMHGLILSEREQRIYANAALGLRWEENAPVAPEQLLQVRRSADAGTDLWSTYNRVQENIIRGGLYGRNAQGRRAHTRGVNSINEDTRINRALWQLAEEMQKQKLAA